MTMNFIITPMDELLKAAAVSKIKKMPKGVQGNMDKYTIIEFHPNFIVIDAPTQSNVIQVKTGIRQNIKINSQHLITTLQKLPKSENIELGVDNKSNLLIVKSDGLQIKLVVEKV